MPIGRLHHVILDCQEPSALAAFYGELLGSPVTYDDGDFAVVSLNDRTSGLAFQRSPDQRAATWPDPAIPQQIHLDVMVDDLDAGHEAVLALGAKPLGGDHVYADPAGHPFCLIPRPHWAPPVNKAVTDKAVTDKAVTDKAVTDKAVADKAVTDKAVTDKAVTDKAVADEDAVNKAAGQAK